MKTILKSTSLALLAILFIFSSCSNKQAGNAQMMSQVREYLVQEVSPKSITLYQNFPATLEGEQTVEIRPRVAGYIEKIFVDEGDYVKKGQVLFQLNANDIRAQVRSAEAQIKVAESQVATAKIELEKTEPLVEKNIISEFQLESVKTNLQSAEAQLAQAQANLANAKANLEYTMISSPTNGFIGTFPYRVGSLVSSSVTLPLTTVSNTASMRAYFSMNEKAFLQLIKNLEGATTAEKLANLPEVDLILPDQSVYAQKGKIEIASGIVDPQTGAINMRASFPNAEGNLRSGGSGNIRLPNYLEDVLLVPQPASYEIQGKHFVYVTNSENKVVNTEIQIIAGDLKDVFVVTSGLKAGDKIVVEGITTLRDGMEIKPKLAGEAVAQSNQPSNN
ncbi:efflux RND transporter periplasmic adaptor subunit [Draconibacterium sp. IB214405]|uniref:efflux RND transporter periplasmic adaptor subunit n=1 Tax=Draconibacterium sp. IB214405 TaxID=3097352 RepID=UPI002A12ADC2|nr:efflux RND transporter periplasmic adaptor subunit [Draconibacterium sp. IB214405]MDX8341314.1 efflux RND transporter periplasmic adaptor subunit [Draconibacterium sp. IB214405]